MQERLVELRNSQARKYALKFSLARPVTEQVLLHSYNLAFGIWMLFGRYKPIVIYYLSWS